MFLICISWHSNYSTIEFFQSWIQVYMLLQHWCRRIPKFSYVYDLLKFYDFQKYTFPHHTSSPLSSPAEEQGTWMLAITTRIKAHVNLNQHAVMRNAGGMTGMWLLRGRKLLPLDLGPPAATLGLGGAKVVHAYLLFISTLSPRARKQQLFNFLMQKSMMLIIESVVVQPCNKTSNTAETV